MIELVDASDLDIGAQRRSHSITTGTTVRLGDGRARSVVERGFIPAKVASVGEPQQVPRCPEAPAAHVLGPDTAQVTDEGAAVGERGNAADELDPGRVDGLVVEAGEQDLRVAALLGGGVGARRQPRVAGVAGPLGDDDTSQNGNDGKRRADDGRQPPIASAQYRRLDRRSGERPGALAQPGARASEDRVVRIGSTVGELGRVGFVHVVPAFTRRRTAARTTRAARPGPDRGGTSPQTR